MGAFLGAFLAVGFMAGFIYLGAWGFAIVAAAVVLAVVVTAS